jgi:transposase InsO family protein
MKYLFVQENRSHFRVEKMCRAFDISRSGYYAWRGREKSIRRKENERLVEKIRKVYLLNREVYGSPRITEELKAQGTACSKNRIARLMRLNRIKARTAKKYRITTRSNHRLPIAPNIVNRDFTARGPDRVWVSDISYIGTGEGWLYLAVILDVFSRQVVGWTMSERLKDDLTVHALRQAVMRRGPLSGLIFHSDRGSQYASSRFRLSLKSHGIIQSMSGTGNCYDNALAESFFHTLKTELTCFERYETRAEARRSIFDYIEVFYNRIRRHSALDYKSPLEYERKTMVA